MSKMSNISLICQELVIEMEDGTIDMDEALEILSEETGIENMDWLQEQFHNVLECA